MLTVADVGGGGWGYHRFGVDVICEWSLVRSKDPLDIDQTYVVHLGNKKVHQKSIIDKFPQLCLNVSSVPKSY